MFLRLRRKDLVKQSTRTTTTMVYNVDHRNYFSPRTSGVMCHMSTPGRRRMDGDPNSTRMRFRERRGERGESSVDMTNVGVVELDVLRSTE